MEYRNTESTYTNTFLKSQKTKLYHAEKQFLKLIQGSNGSPTYLSVVATQSVYLASH